ncbi:hypothetical protein ACJ41O_001069 [Fusarium nematophilum]
MNPPTSSETPQDDPIFEMPPIGSSDQACKECRRRKARCNKALPTCDLCIRYRRHCLYEKHARTPLTRKHLTEVEARLEKAEALVRQMRTLIPPHLRSWEPQPQPQHEETFDFSTVPQPQPKTTPSPDGRAQDDHQRMLEGPPLDDFEWCEQDASHAHGLSPEAISAPDDDSPISDGMASLSVTGREAGYLGVASGAALLRLLEPNPRRRRASSRSQQPPMVLPQPNPNRHIAEAMIDSYFRLYHVSYPILHEPTFRAQYSEVIPRPSGPSWTVLAYVVAAIGVWASSSTASEALDLALFSQARSVLDFNFLEVGNLTLVQALTLASNYQQKRDKPNSGYNYLGLAVRMAMGLGLHKEFQGWNISPLAMEVRRRVWWSLCVFDVGATITFSRPDVWPYKGVEVSLPLNDLTAASQTYPPESTNITPYTAVATQARFHIAVHRCYDRIISKPFPSAEELLAMDTAHIQPWQASVPPYFSEGTAVPPKHALSQAVMSWRLRNLRIIMYRPFVIRRALRRRVDADEASGRAYDRCLADAKSTIEMIAEYWSRHEHNRLAAWYVLYFLFQAALIPCVCLRNDPNAPEAADWRAQISSTLDTIAAMSPVNTSSERCRQVILDLCGRYLNHRQPETPAADQPPEVVNSTNEEQFEPWTESRPVDESPQTQINSVINMMWPNVPPMEAADVVMGDDAGWMEFLSAGGADLWGPSSQ